MWKRLKQHTTLFATTWTPVAWLSFVSWNDFKGLLPPVMGWMLENVSQWIAQKRAAGIYGIGPGTKTPKRRGLGLLSKANGVVLISLLPPVFYRAKSAESWEGSEWPYLDFAISWSRPSWAYGGMSKKVHIFKTFRAKSRVTPMAGFAKKPRSRTDMKKTGTPIGAVARFGIFTGWDIPGISKAPPKFKE